MFVRARIARAVQAHGVLVPQQAVLRGGDGQAQAWVLDGAHKASLKPIAVGDVVNHQYVVSGGLKAGDTVVIEGQERLQPGATAAPQPWKRAAAVATAPVVSAVR